MTYKTDFRAVSYPVRLYSGKDALETLPAELKRHKATRAFVVCGRSVSRKTDLIARIRRILGSALAGVFDEMAKESPLHAVQGAADAARAAQADLLVAVGAGSVIQATRVVAILLAEKGPVASLITQYPEHGPAVSPKLLAPKCPIINVLTAGTSAQNRAGAAVKSETLDHRMEFFDPKTRPVAVYWDADALLTAPPFPVTRPFASARLSKARVTPALGIEKSCTVPPPLSVTSPPPSRPTFTPTVLTLVRVIVTGFVPQLKWTCPPAASAAVSAASVQLAGEPSPMSVGALTSKGWLVAGVMTPSGSLATSV
jgi:hypothetical protein